MEIQINGKTYEVPQSCPKDGPRKGTLKRHLASHGAEAFLASKKYGAHAPCILDELQAQGAEVVMAAQVQEQPDSQLPSSGIPEDTTDGHGDTVLNDRDTLDGPDSS